MTEELENEESNEEYESHGGSLVERSYHTQWQIQQLCRLGANSKPSGGGIGRFSGKGHFCGKIGHRGVGNKRRNSNGVMLTLQ